MHVRFSLSSQIYSQICLTDTEDPLHTLHNTPFLLLKLRPAPKRGLAAISRSLFAEYFVIGLENLEVLSKFHTAQDKIS